MPPQDQRAGVGLVVADTGLDQLMSSRSGGVIHGDDVAHVALGVGEQRLDRIVGWQVGLQERLGVEPDAFNAGEWLEPLREPAHAHALVEHRPHRRGVFLNVGWIVSGTT